MKNRVRKNNSVQAESNVRLVHFEYSDPRGYVDPHTGSVCIAGSFNTWHPSATPMESTGTGLWTADLSLPPGTYQYLFVVDGHWKPDPKCQELVENEFGGVNSVLRVEETTTCQHTTSAAANKKSHERALGL